MLDMPIFDTTPTYSSVNQPGISYPYIAGSSGPHVGPESQAFTKANGIELVARLARELFVPPLRFVRHKADLFVSQRELAPS